MAGARDSRLVSMLEMIESSGGSCPVETILGVFGISKRTLQRDLAKLRMVGKNIEIRDGRVACEDGASYHVSSSEAAMRQLAILSYLTGGPSTLTSIAAYLNDPIRDFNIDERTVRRDMDYLESRGLVEAPGQWNEADAHVWASPGGAGGADRSAAYRLSRAFMPRFLMTGDELVAAVLALESGPEAVADPATVASIRDKLLASVAPDIGPAYRLVQRRFTKGRTRRSDPSILRKVDTLELASLEGRVVRIRYRDSRNRDGAARDVEPLGVVYYWFHDAWYLVARCRKAEELRHFRVDRIDGLILTSSTYEYPDDFDLSDYTAKMWGIFSGEPTRVRVRFFDEMNVVNRLHSEVSGRSSAQLYRVDEGTWELVDTVMGISEFRTWLRTFGSSVVVLEPEMLRSQLIASAERMKEIYSHAPAEDGSRGGERGHASSRCTGASEG